MDDMKSISGYCFSKGSGVLSWCCKKQEVVAQSSAEAEFIAESNNLVEEYFNRFGLDAR